MKFISAVASAIANNIGARELTLGVGLGILGYGLSLVNLPAALIIPGAILIYVSVFGVR